MSLFPALRSALSARGVHLPAPYPYTMRTLLGSAIAALLSGFLLGVVLLLWTAGSSLVHFAQQLTASNPPAQEQAVPSDLPQASGHLAEQAPKASSSPRTDLRQQPLPPPGSVWQEQRLPLQRTSLPYREYSRLSLSDAARQVDFALLQTVIRLKLDRRQILFLQSELRSSENGSYHFQRIRIFLPPVQEEKEALTSSAPQRVAVNAAADFTATLAENLDAWAARGALTEQGSCIRLSAGKTLTHEIWLETTSQPLPNCTPAPSMALVLLEMGLSPEADAKALQLPFPFTGALLPSGQNSAQTAHQLWTKGCDQLLQYPMQSTQSPYVKAGPNELTVEMDAKAIGQRLTPLQKEFPHAAGITSYMGSRFTADPTASAALCDVAAAQGLFVLDAQTSRVSVLAKTAAKAGLPVFAPVRVLDTTPPPVSLLLKNLKEAEQQALRHGSLILLVRSSKETLEALQLWERNPALNMVTLHEIAPFVQTEH